MQSLGLISGLDGHLLMEQVSKSSEGVNTYRVKFGKCNCLFFMHDSNDNLSAIRVCTLTKLGRELYDLCEVEVNKYYINDIVKSLEEQGFKKISTI